LAATVLEANKMTSVIAANGSLCKPHLKKLDVAECQKLPISDATLVQIKQGLIGACSTGGTAFPFFDFIPQVACKTGTAETEEIDKTHAWFTVMAPADNPEIIVTVLVEKGGEGSSVAAPLARQILDFWNLRRNP
jgi:penicillin-binding protein 2